MADKKSVGLTPAKGALIGVLAVVLMAVLYVQFGGSETTVEPAIAEPAPVASKAPTGRTKVDSKPKEVVTATIETAHKTLSNLSSWQPPELETVVQYDPFALPASFPQPRSAEAEAALAQIASDGKVEEEPDPAKRQAELADFTRKLEELRHNGVQVIIRQNDQYVAMIGDQTIHVGDEINGFRVVAIDGNGVHVARDLKQ